MRLLRRAGEERERGPLAGTRRGLEADLPPAEVDALRQLALINDRLLVSPYPGLNAPVVLSSWDRQLRLETVDDPRLLEFITAYTGRSPEPIGSC